MIDSMSCSITFTMRSLKTSCCDGTFGGSLDGALSEAFAEAFALDDALIVVWYRLQINKNNL